MAPLLAMWLAPLLDHDAAAWAASAREVQSRDAQLAAALLSRHLAAQVNRDRPAFTLGRRDGGIEVCLFMATVSVPVLAHRQPLSSHRPCELLLLGPQFCRQKCTIAKACYLVPADSEAQSVQERMARYALYEDSSSDEEGPGGRSLFWTLPQEHKARYKDVLRALRRARNRAAYVELLRSRVRAQLFSDCLQLH